MAHYLPADIWWEILLKLPVESLILDHRLQIMEVSHHEPRFYLRPTRPRRVLLGFGAVNHVYKVIRLAYHYDYPECVFGFPPQAEIFSLGTKGWRRVLGFDIKLRVASCMWRQVLLKDIVHWLGFEPIDDISHRSSILAFDMGDEVFSEVMLPDVLAKKNVETLCLHKIRGSLVVMNSGPPYFSDTNVWVMKEYLVKASWTKLYNIDLPEEYKNNFRMIGFKNGEALLNYNGRDLVSYNLETKQLKYLETRETTRSFYIDDYVESLLLLKGNNVPVVVEIGEA